MKFTSGRSKFAAKVFQTGLVTLVFASGLTLTFVSVIGIETPALREWLKISADQNETNAVTHPTAQSELEVAVPADAVAVTAPDAVAQSPNQASEQNPDQSVVDQTVLNSAPPMNTETAVLNVTSDTASTAQAAIAETSAQVATSPKSEGQAQAVEQQNNVLATPPGAPAAPAKTTSQTQTPAAVKPVKKAVADNQKQEPNTESEEGYVSTSDPFGTEFDGPEVQQALNGKTDEKLALDPSEVEKKKKKTTKRAAALVEDDRSYEEHLREAFASVDEELANPSEEPPFLIGDLELSQSRAWKLLQMNQRLRRDLQRADSQNAKGSRRILINDHLAWAKEFLGQEKFRRYQELNPDLRPETLSRAQESDEIRERRRSGT
jgi:hypothetical protein